VPETNSFQSWKAIEEHTVITYYHYIKEVNSWLSMKIRNYPKKGANRILPWGKALRQPGISFHWLENGATNHQALASINI
jgi:hypothetical protein